MGCRSFMNISARRQGKRLDKRAGLVLSSVPLLYCLRSIVRCGPAMKRIFSHSVAPLTAGLCLRLLFIWKYPANSGDTVLYEQIASNWLQHHVYAMNVHEQVTAVDLRMPGYPAFLAVAYALTRRTGDAARLWVMLGQVAVDLLTCLLVAAL